MPILHRMNYKYELIKTYKNLRFLISKKFLFNTLNYNHENEYYSRVCKICDSFTKNVLFCYYCAVTSCVGCGFFVVISVQMDTVEICKTCYCSILLDTPFDIDLLFNASKFLFTLKTTGDHLVFSKNVAEQAFKTASQFLDKENRRIHVLASYFQKHASLRKNLNWQLNSLVAFGKFLIAERSVVNELYSYISKFLKSGKEVCKQTNRKVLSMFVSLSLLRKEHSPTSETFKAELNRLMKKHALLFTDLQTTEKLFDDSVDTNFVKRFCKGETRPSLVFHLELGFAASFFEQYCNNFEVEIKTQIQEYKTLVITKSDPGQFIKERFVGLFSV